MKINLEIEDLKFKNNKEVYNYVIDILENAVKYDEDKEDILITLEEIQKYLEPLKEVLEDE